MADAPAAVRPSHVSLWRRTRDKLLDYGGLSLPLIVLAFVAAGFAISMLFADVLARADVTDQLLEARDAPFCSVSHFLERGVQT